MDYFSVNHDGYLVYLGVATIEELKVDVSCLTVMDTPKINLGSMACRKLLFHLQNHFNLIRPYQKIILQERQFPYYFVVNEKKYQVSFSHSQTQVAVMVMCHKDNHLMSRFGTKFGIDIEDKQISDAVVRRFFCEEELAWLDALEQSQQIHLQSLAKTLFWTLKESLIKANIEEKLVIGLKNNVCQFLDKKALGELLVENDTKFNQVRLGNGIIGFSPKLKCGFVLLD